MHLNMYRSNNWLFSDTYLKIIIKSILIMQFIVLFDFNDISAVIYWNLGFATWYVQYLQINVYRAYFKQSKGQILANI